ncbi:MAG: sigma-70 family RNA polymerase sigma factor [Prevotella sp.]|nr:sigma-70 family RNA polymerase sigma factor [Prevotella sp.]
MINLEEMTDEELALRYGQGNNKAFDVVLSRNQSKLYAYILFVVHDTEIANDVFQDTFVKAIVKLRKGQYATTGKFSAWLMRIAHNVMIDMFRDKKQEHIARNEDNDLSNIESADLLEGNIETRYIEEQNCKEARILMESLPPAQREIVFMRIYQQMSFKEIAETTGVSINTALGRMRYAILNMRRMASETGIFV